MLIIYIWLVLYIGKTVPLIPASVTQDEATALSKFDYWEGTNNNKKNSNFLINNEFRMQDRIDFLGYVKLFDNDDRVATFIDVQPRQQQAPEDLDPVISSNEEILAVMTNTLLLEEVSSSVVPIAVVGNSSKMEEVDSSSSVKSVLVAGFHVPFNSR